MSHRKSRVAAASLAVLAVAGTAACGASTGGSGTGTETVGLWSHAGGNAEELAVINDLVDAFNSSQDRFEVQVQAFPQDAYNGAVVAAAMAGNLPCLLAVDGPNVPNWAWAGYIQPLGLPESLWEGQLPGTVNRLGDEVYAFGFYDVALAMITRQSTLDDAGVRTPTVDDPWSKAEFMEALSAIDALDRFSFALDMGTGDGGEWLPYAYSPQLQSFGGDLIDRSTYLTAEGVLNGPEALEWAQWFRGLVVDGYMAERSGTDATMDFVNGASGIVWSGQWAMENARAAFDDLVVLPPPDFGHGPVIGAGTWQWALSTHCESVEGAREFLTFAHDTDWFVAFAEAIGAIPATDAATERVPALGLMLLSVSSGVEEFSVADGEVAVGAASAFEFADAGWHGVELLGDVRERQAVGVTQVS